MKRLVLAFLLISSFAAYAQKGSVSGAIIDSLTQKPVEFATVTVLNQSGKPINGGACDESGKFNLAKIDKGNYQLVVSFVGYANKKISFAITDKNAIVNFGNISISPSAKMLHEVVVE